MPLVDFQYVDKASAGDANMRRELLSLFVEQMEALGCELDEQLAADDMEALARTAHSVKSTALAMGMTDMADALKKIEIVCKKILLASSRLDSNPSRRALYEGQINAISADLDGWTQRNLSKESLHELIAFCVRQSASAVIEVREHGG